MSWLWFGIGLMVGACLGALVMAMVQLGSIADERDRRLK
jgi:uncharacterized membrane-anchored protein YhcB (DUF1043 family)